MAELPAISVENTKSVVLVYFGRTIDEKDVLVPSEAHRPGYRMPIAVLWENAILKMAMCVHI